MKKIFVFSVNFYKKRISPLKKSCCRFYPSCSSYAVLAVDKHGFFKGIMLALWRVLRCNPFSAGGVDMP